MDSYKLHQSGNYGQHWRFDGTLDQWSLGFVASSSHPSRITGRKDQTANVACFFPAARLGCPDRMPAFLPRDQWSTLQNGDFRALPDGAIPQHSGFLMLLN